MSTGIKKLKDKYFVKEEDGGYKLNKEEAKKSAQSAMFDAILLGTAVAGTLCVIGLAQIGRNNRPRGQDHRRKPLSQVNR